jgi:amino acid adenylation domain-containing protein
VTAETVLSRADSDLVRQAAEAAGLNPGTMIIAAWALLRAHYGGVSDVVLAVTRPLASTVPLRVRIDEEGPVRELLTAVNEGLRLVGPHQHTAMGPALTWAGLSPDTALVDSQLTFDRPRPQAGLPYPLTVSAHAEPQVHLSLSWDRRRFAEGSAQRMLDQLRATLIEFAGRPSAPLADLDLGRAAEGDVLAGWNRTGVGYPADATIPALFAAQVARNPDAVALVSVNGVSVNGVSVDGVSVDGVSVDGVSGAGSLTYAELDRRSNALSWLLRRRGVTTDMPVGVAMDRGTDLVTALLAVLKAGGAYLPIDMGSPASRVAAMIAVAGARLVLVTAETAAAMPQLAGVDLVRVDADPALAAAESTAPPDTSHPLSLAYISFTSGSTGVPKGVAVPQRAVIRLISNPMFASLGPGERLLHLSPVAFDASTLEIWGALLTGATVVVAPPGPLGLSDIASALRTAAVTVTFLTAGLFHQLAEADLDAIAGVPVVLTGGEVLNPDTVRAVLAARRGRPLVNAYGPTENTTFTTCHVMTDPSQAGPTVPIGPPIQHTTVHVLDQRGRPAPIGVTGELYTGGDGLARGYAGNAAATARAFVPDPSGHGTRLYRTGDLARWRADGTLEFVGRVDDQVKIRGFRVEPGEVEAALRAHPGVREAFVLVAGEGAQRHLIGYVTPADGVDPGALRPSLLRDFVAGRLPDYLVPTGFRAVDRLPLKGNGKVDRARLPAPERETRGPAALPRGATEERLVGLWRPLLPADGPSAGDIGRDESFFALGGNSLLAARLMFRIREVFDVELSLAAFYEAPTLASSAAAIDAARQSAAPSNIGRRDRRAYRVAAPQLVRLEQAVPERTVADWKQEG